MKGIRAQAGVGAVSLSVHLSFRPRRTGFVAIVDGHLSAKRDFATGEAICHARVEAPASTTLGKRDPFGIVAGHFGKAFVPPVVFRAIDSLQRARDEVPQDVALAVELRAADDHDA